MPAPAKMTKTKKTDDQPPVKVVADNRRARHEYEILETFEAGLALSGTEVKAMRQGKANLQESFARIEDNEIWLYRCHISPYDFGNRFNHDPLRKRRLLMHRRQINKLKAQTQEKGLALIPLKLYFKGNWAKIDLALARGKQLYDKRQSIAKRENQRQIERIIKQKR
jgi:SsrA-binding protein